MIHHVSVEVSDLERAGRFYDAVVGALGWRRHVEEPDLIGWGIVRPLFFASTRHPIAPGGGHVCFTATGIPARQGRLGGRSRRRRHRRRGAGAAARVRCHLLLGIPARPGREQDRDRGRRVVGAGPGGPKRSTGGNARHGPSQGRHQRLRPDRQQPLPRRPRGGRGPRHRRGQRHHRHGDARPPPEVRLDPRPLPGRGARGGRRDRGRRERGQGAGRARPRRAPLGRSGRGGRDRVHRALHQARGRLEASRRRRQEGDHLGPGDRARRDRGPRRQLRRATTTPRAITSSPTPRARPTAWRRWRRSSTTRSASRTG